MKLTETDRLILDAMGIEWWMQSSLSRLTIVAASTIYARVNRLTRLGLVEKDFTGSVRRTDAGRRALSEPQQ